MTLLIIYIHDQSSISRLKSVHVHINPPSTNDPQMHLTVHMIWQFFAVKCIDWCSMSADCYP